MSERPVMYLDVDDTLLTYHKSAWVGVPLIASADQIVAAPGACDFLIWALEHFEVRWLTCWCPSGAMHSNAAARLGKALGIDPDVLVAIRGIPWITHGLDKTNGIDWPEFHAGRPFVWVEDEILPSERITLAAHGASGCWIDCNVTRDPERLLAVHAMLRERLAA
jgi:hypothetical protein